MATQLIRDTQGATAIEYSMIAALISIVAVIAFRMLGLNLAGVFTAASNGMALP